ncbi:TIGR00266 family protein [Rhodoplanes roseus]|uniref:TIGR00266 family protein n=1 Tax=Rhodoplanes roseus TaxID=29409 RepID=A0A327KMN5_9BRAD|nr:TIGR00266 family protein [Rhodoplanes roseus]RAI39234.1 TIGR00266 family protein [Rhodoplanes roseus]
MQSKIIGTTLPVLEIALDAGDAVVGVPDQLSWMSGDITMTTSMGGAGGGGVWGLVSRAVSGGGLFTTRFEAGRGSGLVGFAARLPGAIMEIEVTPDRTMLAHRHGFVCGTPGIEIATAAQTALGGLFGGTGFLLQRIGGSGTAWIELGGEIVTYGLEAGQSLLVHPGHVGMFEQTVGFEITTIKGIRNALFGGDGLFLARLTGPGKVWLQTLTTEGLAHAVAPYLPAKRG